MGTLRAKIVDKNRLSKRYPLIRAPARFTYMGDSDMAIEVGSIYFDNAESGTLTFDAQFIDADYQVVAMTRSSNNETADVNVFVSNKSQNSVTIQASSNFTGYVDVFAVRVG